MSEEKKESSGGGLFEHKGMLMFTVLILPIAGVILSFLEVFGDKPETVVKIDPGSLKVSDKETAEQKAQRLAEEASKESDPAKRYNLYSNLATTYKDQKNLAETANKEMAKIKQTLTAKIESLAKEENWDELKKQKDVVAKIMPDKVSWVTDQLKKAGQDTGSKKKMRNEWVKKVNAWKKEAHKKCKAKDFESAASVYDNIDDIPYEDLKKKAQASLADVHLKHGKAKYAEGSVNPMMMDKDSIREILEKCSEVAPGSSAAKKAEKFIESKLAGDGF